MKRFLLAAIAVTLLGSTPTPDYSIEAIRYANSPAREGGRLAPYCRHNEVDIGAHFRGRQSDGLIAFS